MKTEIIQNYLDRIAAKYAREQTSEYGYRRELEELLEEVFKSNVRKLAVDNDPKAQNHNKPDFVIMSGELPIMYLEAKPVGTNLDRIVKSEQMSRYFGYDNLVLTDCLDWRFFRNGLLYQDPIVIGINNKKARTVSYLSDNFELLLSTLQQFPTQKKETIKSGNHLAKIMGGKAQRIRDNVKRLLTDKKDNNRELENIYNTIRKLLVSDLSLDGFADMYAQTLVYGLFVARYYDSTSEDFSRKEARDLIPASNPFLQQFFDHIAGANFPRSLSFIIDELCEAFVRSDVQTLMEEHLDSKIEDPIIHFYEDFLTEYDIELKKRMGAYYTPMPVVNYMVRSVDAVLQKEFSIKDGLADASKITDTEHRVQILDPATGTGTFISQIIRVIYERFVNQKGRWPAYVLHNLLPRLYGFELMMTPYTIAHLRLSLSFKKTGFKYFNQQRLGIYLTNTLDNHTPQQEQIFVPIGLVGSLAQEAKIADEIKNSKPIMIVIGNPPYSGESSNKTQYALNLVNKYKTEPGGKQKLQEKNPKWLNDDYVKFIAFAEDMVAKNQSGIVAFITNNGFLDNPTFRGMRWHLRQTFDKIYVLNLHGNAKKRETAPDGSKDENVFDIMQGVSIMIAIKTSQDITPAQIHYSELFGLRQEKFAALNEHKIKYEQIFPDTKNEFFVPKNSQGQEEYERGIPLNELMPVNAVGIVTARDRLCIQETKKNIEMVINDVKTLDVEKLRTKYSLGKDVRDWTVAGAKNDILSNEGQYTQIQYRPFDKRWTYYTGNSRGFMCYPRKEVMRHMIDSEDSSTHTHTHTHLESEKEHCHDL